MEFRRGDYSGETHNAGIGLVVIGDANQPFGSGNAWFREVAVMNCTDILEYELRQIGANVSEVGAFKQFIFRGNTGSATGISNTVAIRQALHKTGFQYHSDCWQWQDEEEVENLFGELV